MLYPLRFTPLYYDKVWGGRRFETLLGRAIPAGEKIGESWEVADHPHGMSVVCNGSEAGATLRDLVTRYPDALLGPRVAARYGATFPLLIKYIDADEALSVQVHPDDAYAMAHEGEQGKTEMWYVLHADPGAQLIVGLAPGTTAEQFAEALQHGDPGALLHRVPVKAGDSIFIPSGRIHAIMPGLMLLEIQQSSDTTYRLYDWGRPRQLHVQQALDVTNWQDYAPTPSVVSTAPEGPNRKTVLAQCPYFLVEKFDLQQPREFVDAGSFRVLNCVAGQGTLRWAGGAEPLACGDSLLLPAMVADFAIEPDGEVSVVISSVP